MRTLVLLSVLLACSSCVSRTHLRKELRMNVGDQVELVRVGKVVFEKFDDGAPVFTRPGVYEGKPFQHSKRVEEGDYMALGNKNHVTVLEIYDDGSIYVKFTEREPSHPFDW